MNAGKYRHVISIVEISITPDGMGGGTQTETLICKTRAGVFPNGGRELYRGMQLQTEHTHVVEMRYRPGVKGKHVVLFGTRRLEIETVQNVDERNQTLRLACRETFPKER